jgi:hypothetical protein
VWEKEKNCRQKILKIYEYSDIIEGSYGKVCRKIKFIFRSNCPLLDKIQEITLWQIALQGTNNVRFHHEKFGSKNF